MKENKTNRAPLVSIVVATKNEATDIKRLLTSAFAQTYKNIEIFCIDDSDTSETMDVIKSFPVTGITKGPERSAKRNEGIKRANGEWILWLDADMSLKPDTIRACVELCTTNELDYVVIQEKIPGNSLFAKMRNFENELLLNTVISVPRFIRAELFKKIGGFDESMNAAEDWDMERRLSDLSKKKGTLLQTAEVGLYHHEEQLSYQGFLRKKRKYVVGCRIYEQKWGSNDRLVRLQLRPLPRFFHILTAKGNLLRILKHPILFGYMLLFKALPSLFIYKTSQ